VSDRRPIAEADAIMSKETEQTPSKTIQRPLVLVVDDHKLSRELLKAYLEAAGFDTVEAKNGKEALAVLAERRPSLVILDLLMPVMDGFEVCRRIKEDSGNTLLPIIVVTGLEDYEARMKALSLGADDFINKPITDQELVTRVRNHLRIKELTDQLENAENIILALVRIMEAKDPYTRGHSERVSRYSRLLAQELGMSDEKLQLLGRAGMLHDVGKLGIDDAIIRSPDELTQEEREKVHSHPSKGSELISSLSSLADALALIESHHERFDGTGYPHRLAREEIPLEARIIAVADTFDALTTDRPYRKALSIDEALDEMQYGAATGQLDPRLVDTFIALMNRLGSLEAAPEGETL
jgi:putative two-component system response regulator